MKLRYRLFIWVGILFFLAFAISFYVEEHVTRANLMKTRKNLLKELYQVNEEKRKSIDFYVADMLWKMQAQIDAVLQGVANYQLIQKGFMPSADNLRDGTWLDSASLMITNQWLGLVQNLSEDNLMAEIIVHSDDLDDTYHFPIQDNIHLVAIRDAHDSNKWKGPYIGIGFDLNTWHQANKSPPVKESDEDYFVFFTPQTLLQLDLKNAGRANIGLSVNLLEPFLKWIEIPYKTFYLESFVARIKKAQALIKANPHLIPSNEEWKQLIDEKNVQGLKHDLIDFECFAYLHEKTEKGLSEAEQFYRKEVIGYVKKNIEHYNKIGLTWGIAALTDTELFGKRPVGPNSPYGMGMLDTKTHCGKGLKSEKVFKNKIQYDIYAAIKGMKLPPDFLTTHLDVITPKEYHHVFFGNTLKLEDPSTGRMSYLTLASHGGPILAALARATQQVSMFVSNDRIVAISDSHGDELSSRSSWYNMPVNELMNKTSGVVSFDGEEYFFLHITPYEQADVHFFIFNLKSKEFQFVDSINEGTEDLIEKLSMQMRIASIIALIIVLFFLNNIAKRVTKPIAHLAEVTQTVAEGKLDEIEIPKDTEKKRKDEVYALYHAFFEMVKGLREKEKVRGVLNKVVSKEIAEETLKGNVQLGGEEKRATVFFADIRDFTSMTEHMDPKDVIQLINSCMTKISKKIDEYGGVIDKYVGDEVMALFGAPIEKEDSALNAIKCAVDILETFETWNRERELPIQLGIGIHTGKLVAGNMGAEDRLNYTVLGANVNLASRLCGQAKPMQILISSATLDEQDVKLNIEVEELREIELKGFTEPVPIFAVKSYKKGKK